MEEKLSLSEQLYLLGIHPEKGGIVSASYGAMSYVLAGACLLEMQQNGNIGFENKRVLFKHAKSSNPIHRFFLDKIRAAKSPRKIRSWLSSFNFRSKKLYREVQSQLCKKRIIRMRQKRFLFIKWKSPEIINKSLVYRLTDEVRTCISKGTQDEEKLVLLSMILPAKLQHRLYRDRHKRKDAVKKLKEIWAENPVSKEVKAAIEAAQAVAASVAVSTTVSS